MNPRIHEFLDGNLKRTDLALEDRAELQTYETAINAAVSALSSVSAASGSDLTGPVMEAIRPSKSGNGGPSNAAPQRRLGRLAWSASGLAVAALTGLLFLAGPDADASQIMREGGTVVAEGGADHVVMVELAVDAPGARSVELAGDFSGWMPAGSLVQAESGKWSASFPFTLGVHEYAFLIDGHRWVLDPRAEVTSDGFGGQNSRLAVMEPAAG